MRWRARRRSDGRWELYDPETGDLYGGGRHTWATQREAEDQASVEEAWAPGGRQPDPDEAQEANERLIASRTAAANRRASAFDPEDQQERIDEGGTAHGGYVEYGPVERRASDVDETLADVPVLGWLTGASSRRDAARAMTAEERNRAIWQELNEYMPTPDALAVEYEADEYYGGPERSEASRAQASREAIEAQSRALGGLAEIAHGGGLTAEDRARMELGRQAVGREMRSQREADLAALEARGTGGSGAALAARMGAQQYGAQALSQRDAQMQIAAQQRALEAMSREGQLAGQMRGQSFGEEYDRGGAADDFNRYQTDYERAWRGRRADAANRTRQSRSDARRSYYEQRERQAAGMTGQYSTDVSRRQSEGQRQDQQSASLTAALAEIIG